MGTKVLFITLVISIVSTVMKNRYKKEDKNDSKEKDTPAYLAASIIRDMSVIIFSALLALWLTNYDEDLKARTQMRSYYTLEMKQNWNIVRDVWWLYDLMDTDTSWDAFMDKEAEYEQYLSDIISEKGLNEDSINYSEMAISHSDPDIMSGIYRAVNARNEELARLREFYQTDQDLTPRVYFEMYHVALQAFDAYRAYQFQLDWLDGKKLPESAYDGLHDPGMYEDMPKEMEEIHEHFFKHFPGTDYDYMFHNYFSKHFPDKDIADVTWEDVEAFDRQVEELMKRGEEEKKKMTEWLEKSKTESESADGGTD